jgi:hypothetical protein
MKKQQEIQAINNIGVLKYVTKARANDDGGRAAPDQRSA